MRMTHKDNLAILAFYGKDASAISKKEAKKAAEKILAEKLCRCIKKVRGNDNQKNESRAIAICTDSVLRKKNLRSYGFRCKKKPMLIGSKSRGTSKKLSKIRGGARRTRRC